MQGPKILEKTFLGKGIFYVLAFIQYYPVIFKGIGISTRVLSAVLGVAILLIHLYVEVDRKRTFAIHPKIIYLLLPFLGMILTSYVSMYINMSADNYFGKYIVTPGIMLMAAYGTVMIGKMAFGLERITFRFLAMSCIKIVLFQDILSVFMYTIPSLKDFLYSFIMLDPIEMAEFGEEGDSGSRLMGFGANFMNLGVANCVALLLIAVLVKNAKAYGINWKVILFLAFSFIYISVIGMMQARTTMVGTGLGMLYMFASTVRINLNSFAQSITSLFKLAVLLAILGWIVLSIFPDTVKKHEDLIDYGFEMFISLKERGTIETGSTNALKGMYRYPESIQSWVIGDAHFLGETGGFYKGTDVGWLRLVYYFGIIGAVFYYLYEFMIIYQTFLPEEKNAKLLVVYFFAMIAIIHFKSFTEITTYIAVFWIYNIAIRKRQGQIAEEAAESERQTTSYTFLQPNYV